MNTCVSLRLAKKQSIAEGIVLLELTAPDGRELPPFTAGAHLLLNLPGGLSRAYSLCNDPAERHRYQLAINLDPRSRGGSRAVHEQLAVGDLVSAQGPNNLFPLDSEAPHALLFAGGIGITPVLSMARYLQAQGRSWSLHYATRSHDRCAFHETLTSSPLASSSHLYFDDGAANRRLDLAQTIASAPAGAHLYVCGPTGFIDAALDAARAQGWAESRLHSERFGATAPVAVAERRFTLKLERSGLTLEVPPDQTAMAVMLAAGVDVPFSCEQGICGTCITDVLEGRPDHRDQCLDDETRAMSFTPCCSRSLDDCLRIDL